MIDRHYGHLAHDGREQAIRRLDTLNIPTLPSSARWTFVDAMNVEAAERDGLDLIGLQDQPLLPAAPS